MAYLENLRPGKYISPGDIELDFKFDTLVRSGAKKASVTEILDSDESVAQDQGNVSDTFPMDIYFTGDEYDADADAFYVALSERYSQDKPGILIHPRWGDIPVMPISWQQSEAFVSGAKAGRFTVTFRRVFPTSFPLTDILTESNALSNIDDMKELTAGITGAMDLKQTASVIGKLRGALGIVSNSLRAIAAGPEGLIATFDAIQSTIDGLIDDIGNTIATVIIGIQTLMLLPGKIISETQDSINGYVDMIDSLVNSFSDENVISDTEAINNVIMLELIAGMGSAALAQTAVFTNYFSRKDGSDAIDKIADGYNKVILGIENGKRQGLITDTYIGDHNYLSKLQDTITNINSILLNKSFDLKAEKKLILSVESDPISLCNKFYNDISNEKINFFITTNKITNDEFIEIPAGREVVFYE